jgi:hypothetical protein
LGQVELKGAKKCLFIGAEFFYGLILIFPKKILKY